MPLGGRRPKKTARFQLDSLLGFKIILAGPRRKKGKEEKGEKRGMFSTRFLLKRGGKKGGEDRIRLLSFGRHMCEISPSLRKKKENVLFRSSLHGGEKGKRGKGEILNQCHTRGLRFQHSDCLGQHFANGGGGKEKEREVSIGFLEGKKEREGHSRRMKIHSTRILSFEGGRDSKFGGGGRRREGRKRRIWDTKGGSTKVEAGFLRSNSVEKEGEGSYPPPFLS